MKKLSGLYPRVRVHAAGAGVVSQAGAVLLVETARAVGLDQALSTALQRWQRPGARHDSGKVVPDLAVALAVGGDCLADVAVLRGEPRVGVPLAPQGLGESDRSPPTRPCPAPSAHSPPTRPGPWPRSERLEQPPAPGPGTLPKSTHRTATSARPHRW